ncbi:MAG: FkbM family methyltransferase [Candidatus Njordarchaeales archaeon]
MVSTPSIRGFLEYLKLRFMMVMKGEGIFSKVRLFIWALLDSMPRTIMCRMPPLKHYVECAKNWLASRIMINLDGNKFYCIDSESIWILSYEFENWMWEHLKLNKGDVFVDVGAHIGKYTVPVAKIVGENGLVIAVEPHPENYRTLVKNIRLNDLKNVLALNIAAWSEECKLKNCLSVINMAIIV